MAGYTAPSETVTCTLPREMMEAAVEAYAREVVAWVYAQVVAPSLCREDANTALAQKCATLAVLAATVYVDGYWPSTVSDAACVDLVDTAGNAFRVTVTEFQFDDWNCEAVKRAMAD